MSLIWTGCPLSGLQKILFSSDIRTGLNHMINPSLLSLPNTKAASHKNIVQYMQKRNTSMVGSYSSTKWFWMSWMVSALLPTPPAPTTTSLYSVIFPAAAHHTRAHTTAGEKTGSRVKVQVSTLTRNVHVARFQRNNRRTQSFDRLCHDAVHNYRYRQSIQLLPLVSSGEKHLWFLCVSCSVCVCV